ncbi:hypothetical protein [Aquihabitans sp. McL0605]|uniref:hypothetical protein n=1 Tax=Aquihabitans sp. McL0605 TaxID=3415671 RepID=UPI003CE70193
MLSSVESAPGLAAHGTGDGVDDPDPTGAGDASTPTEPAESAGERARGATLSQIIGILLALVGLRIGLHSLHDNSFFTHLATGRMILHDHAIPRTDPYSFTAPGRAWTVQSWGASVIYASIDKVFGLVGIRVVVGVICAALAALAWRLTSPAKGLIGRLAIVVPVLCVGAGFWVERPLIFSLLFLMAVLFALEDRLDPRWLVPIMWVWVNVHGSFPIAIMAIVAFGFGRLLDRERPTTELRVLGWAGLGTLLGGILSPLGWRLLVFPVQLLQRRDAFSHIAEWQSPTWSSWAEKAFAIQVILALVLIVWRGRRWRNAVPVVLFAALSVQSSRNIVHASLIMIPAMAAAAHGLGVLDGLEPRRILRPVRVALLALMALVLAVGILQTPNLNLVDYPVQSAKWMRGNGLLDRSDRVVTRDFVGNYLEVEYGPEKVHVFIDDRVDMYPDAVITDYAALLDHGADYQAVLDRADASAVLWDTDSDFGDWLEDPAHGWKIVHRETGWMVAVPVGASSP